MSNISHTFRKFYRFELIYPAGKPQYTIINTG